MKLDTDKCHLLVSGTKYEHSWAKIGDDKIWEGNEFKFLGVKIDNNLKFNSHIANIWFKTNKKTKCIKGTTESYFTHYSSVVIILFNAGLCRSAFSTISVGKLFFCLSVLSAVFF